MPGFLYINKPVRPTSHDIVDRIRRMTGVKTVGHAGTLDPFASGLLIVGVGREATREFPCLVGLDKRYRATLRLGATSDTDDRTGIIRHREAEGRGDLERRDCLPAADLPEGDFVATLLAMTTIETVLNKFTGKIKQIPPMYSAKKIKGKKLYELARAGQVVERQPVEIEIYSIAESKFQQPESKKNPNSNNHDSINGELESGLLASGILSLEIHCSSGTYIRALARDIGEALGCGAYLEELERIAVGPFALEEAVKMEDLDKENWEKYLQPINTVIARSEQSE